MFSLRLKASPVAWSKKYEKKIPAAIFFPIFGQQNPGSGLELDPNPHWGLDPDPQLEKLLDPDPYYINADP